MSDITDKIVEVLIEHAFVDGFCDCGEFDSAMALDPEGCHAEHVAEVIAVELGIEQPLGRRAEPSPIALNFEEPA